MTKTQIIDRIQYLIEQQGITPDSLDFPEEMGIDIDHVILENGGEQILVTHENLEFTMDFTRIVNSYYLTK